MPEAIKKKHPAREEKNVFQNAVRGNEYKCCL